MTVKQAALDLIRLLPDDVTADVLFDELRAKLGAPDDGTEFIAELERRADAIENGTAVGRPGEVVMRELRERFR